MMSKKKLIRVFKVIFRYNSFISVIQIVIILFKFVKIFENLK